MKSDIARPHNALIENIIRAVEIKSDEDKEEVTRKKRTGDGSLFLF